MFKKTLAALAALVASTPAALAGPYVNGETNVSLTGSDYNSALHELHIGYEGSAGVAGYYVQAGPSVSAVDNVDSELEFSGKAGASVYATETISAYGELSFITGDETSYGVKAGFKADL